MRVLVTRHQDEALHTASALLALGISGITEPLFDVRDYTPEIPEIEKYQAVIITSRNSARIFRSHYKIPKIPAYCVGDQTAGLVLNAGFSAVHSANGAAADLAALVRFKCDKNDGPILRLFGEMPSDPLGDALREDGYTIDTVTLYEMTPRKHLSSNTQNLLQDNPPDGVTFFSPRAAQHFAELVTQSGLSEACRTMTAWCISKKTAAFLKQLPFRAIEIAAHPTHQAMLDSIAATKARQTAI